MKKFITMILAIAMVITSVVVPMDKVNAAENEYVWEQYCGCPDDGSYSMTKRLIIGYDNNGRPITNNYEGISTAYYDANGNMVGLKENGVWVKCIPGKTLILPNSDTIDDDGTYKGWDTNGNLIYQENPDGTVVIDKRIGKYIGVSTKYVIRDFYSEPERDYKIIAGFEDTAPLKCYDENFRKLDVTWSSSNDSIATVNANNTLVGKKAGKVTMTATVKANGQKVTIPVRVVKDVVETDKSESVYSKAYYDTKGNLIWKVRFKNVSKKKTIKVKSLRLVIKNGKSKFTKKQKAFTIKVKPKKSKTITIKIKKSKLKGKRFNLSESNVKLYMKCNFIWKSDNLENPYLQ